MDRQTRVKPIIQINTEHLKKVLPQLGGILILFIFLAIAYFAPAEAPERGTPPTPIRALQPPPEAAQ